MKQMLSLKVQIRNIYIDVAENIHAVIVDKRAPRKVRRVVDLISPEVELSEGLRACKTINCVTNYQCQRRGATT